MWYENVFIKNNIPNNELKVELQHYTRELALGEKSGLVTNENGDIIKISILMWICKCNLHYLTLP